MRKWIDEEYEGVVVMDGYDDCIVGICHRFNQEPIVAYSYEKVIGKLVADGMTYDEAIEFFDFNQIGSWVGERTPCFIEKPPHRPTAKFLYLPYKSEQFERALQDA